MKRSLTIIIILLSAFYVNAQDNALKLDYPIRKMEVFGYATANLAPNEIYTSFVIKEYTDDNKIISIKESEENIKKIVKTLDCDISDF